MKSFRYKGKNCISYGVHAEFLKRRLRYGGYHQNLILPQPKNVAEIKLLSAFIFGVELGVKFDRIHDVVLQEIKNDKTFARKYKLNMLSSDRKDYFSGHYNGKMILLYLMYECTTLHSEYYDSKFNYEVFDSSYELDNSFWKHCVGEISSGGIGGYSYGQLQVTSLKERNRLLNMMNNPEQEARPSFIKKLNRLKRKDKQFDIENNVAIM